MHVLADIESAVKGLERSWYLLALGVGLLVAIAVIIRLRRAMTGGGHGSSRREPSASKAISDPWQEAGRRMPMPQSEHKEEP